MKLARGISVGLGAAIAAFALVAVFARFADGPIGPVPGGALRGGPIVEGGVASWDFVARVPEVELQLLDPARSRTTWILLHEARAYIPCGFPNFRLWKQWPHEAMEDGRAIVRIAGRRYPVELVRVEDPDLVRDLTADLTRKYEAMADYSGAVWFFRLEPGSSRG